MDNNNQVQRFDPGQLNAYQVGQQLAAQMFSPPDTTSSSMRGMRMVQREARVINGEMHITEQEWDIFEEQGQPIRGNQAYQQPAPPRRSWIDIMFGIN